MTQYTYIILEDPDEPMVHVGFSREAMPTEFFADYPDAESAMRANPDLPWREPTDEDEADGDVLYIAEISR